MLLWQILDLLFFYLYKSWNLLQENSENQKNCTRDRQRATRTVILANRDGATRYVTRFRVTLLYQNLQNSHFPSPNKYLKLLLNSF